MPKLGMATATTGKGKKVSQNLLAAEVKARRRVKADMVRAHERRVYWEHQDQIDSENKENIATFKTELEQDQTDMSLPVYCRHGDEGINCKFRSACRFYHGGCLRNLKGNICTAHTKGQCGMRHCKNQEKLPYQHAEYVDEITEGEVAVAVRDEGQVANFDITVESFVALSL